VAGEHVWWESDRERREQAETVVPWDMFKSASVTASRLDLKPAPPSMIPRSR
jgi:hypothetical protein